MTDLKDLFGESDDDDDDFTPAERNKPQASPALSEEGEEREAGAAASGEGAGTVEEGEHDGDDDDAFQDKPAPRQPSQLRDYSDEDDEDGIVQHVEKEPETGPPADLEGFLLPFPAPNSLRLLTESKLLRIEPAPASRDSLLLEGYAYDEAKGEHVPKPYGNQLTIRWRQQPQPDGEVKRESNARFVTWSDGSRQLLVGDEALDIADLDNTSANQYLFVRHHGTSVFIQGQGRIAKKLQVRPASLQSKLHRQLLAESQKNLMDRKRKQAKYNATVADPNAAKAAREKEIEDEIRVKESLKKKQGNLMNKSSKAARRQIRGSVMTPQYLETLDEDAEFSDDDDPEATATERARAALQRRPQRDEEEEAEAERRLARAKQLEPSWAQAPGSGRKRMRVEEDEDEDSEMQDFIVDGDEDDEDIGRKQPSKKGRRGGLVISDDEDD